MLYTGTRDYLIRKSLIKVVSPRTSKIVDRKSSYYVDYSLEMKQECQFVIDNNLHEVYKELIKVCLIKYNINNKKNLFRIEDVFDEIFIFKFSKSEKSERPIVDNVKGSFMQKHSIRENSIRNSNGGAFKKDFSSSFSFNDNSLNFSNQNIQNVKNSMNNNYRHKNQIILEVIIK